jgi:hypothetical protein
VTTINAEREARQPSYKLTFSDAVDVWKLCWNGWFQNRIAAKYDVNPGRVNEVIKERVHQGSKEFAKRGKN